MLVLGWVLIVLALITVLAGTVVNIAVQSRAGRADRGRRLLLPVIVVIAGVVGAIGIVVVTTHL